MRIHKNTFIGLFFLAFFASHGTLLWAQPNTFTAIAPEKVVELELLHQKATELILKNDFEGAIRTYSDILLMEPDDETAYTALGQVYLVLGQYRKAHEAFQNALHIDPYNQVAAIGIQKIMDPDGVEGMLTSDQAETENVASAPLRAPNTAAGPRFAPQAKMESRSSAGRAKKNANETHETAVKRVKTPPRGSSGFGRPGLLNAQRVQMALKNAGFYAGPVNGLVGGSTKKALAEFQKKNGLPVTGKTSSETWQALSAQL